jgi:hypothetical protein
MKSVLNSILLLSIFVACKSNASNNSAAIESGNTDKPAAMSTSTETGGGDCGSLILFKEGTVITSHTLNAEGKETSNDTSMVTKVTNEGGIAVAKVTSKVHIQFASERTTTLKYSCDGKMLSCDINSMFASMQKGKTTIEGTDVQFPIKVIPGEDLPNASYSFTTTAGKKTMKIICTIKNRKVFPKQSITIPAGTFEAYKITSDVESETQMEGMDERTKAVMESMKDRMPKIHYVMWYVPTATIVKVELYMGDKLSSTTELTSIK